MTIKQMRDGRFWCVEVMETVQRVVDIIFCKEKNRVVIKLHGATIVVENMSEKELNNE